MTLKHTFLGAVSCFAAVLCSADELVYGIENEIKDFNISRSLDKNAFALSELVTEALFYLRPDGTLVPELAKSYHRKGRLWTFQLKASRFSNGKAVGCKDVMENILEAKASPRPVRSRLKEIEKVECEKGELRITTYNDFPQLLHRMGYIVRVYDVTTIKSDNPVGSGPFYIQAKKDKDIILVPNPYSTQRTEYSRIIFRTLRDPWLRDLAILSGNIDFLLEGFSLQRIRSLVSRKEVLFYKNPSQMLYYLAFNGKKYTQEFRNYLKSIIRYEKLVPSFWGEQAEVADRLFRQSTFSVTTPVKKPKSLAKRQVLEVSLVADETQINFLKSMAKAFLKYNLELKIRPLEFASYMNRLNAKNFDSYLFYVDTTHPLNLESLLRSRSSRLNIDNQRIDQALSFYAQSDQPQSLMKELAVIEAEVEANSYLIPLYRNYKELVLSSKVDFLQTEDGFWRDLLRSRKYNGSK